MLFAETSDLCSAREYTEFLFWASFMLEPCFSNAIYSTPLLQPPNPTCFCPYDGIAHLAGPLVEFTNVHLRLICFLLYKAVLEVLPPSIRRG